MPGHVILKRARDKHRRGIRTTKRKTPARSMWSWRHRRTNDPRPAEDSMALIMEDNGFAPEWKLASEERERRLPGRVGLNLAALLLFGSSFMCYPELNSKLGSHFWKDASISWIPQGAAVACALLTIVVTTCRCKNSMVLPMIFAAPSLPLTAIQMAFVSAPGMIFLCCCAPEYCDNAGANPLVSVHVQPVNGTACRFDNFEESCVDASWKLWAYWAGAIFLVIGFTWMLVSQCYWIRSPLWSMYLPTSGSRAQAPRKARRRRRKKTVATDSSSGTSSGKDSVDDQSSSDDDSTSADDDRLESMSRGHARGSSRGRRAKHTAKKARSSRNKRGRSRKTRHKAEQKNVRDSSSGKPSALESARRSENVVELLRMYSNSARTHREDTAGSLDSHPVDLQPARMVNADPHRDRSKRKRRSRPPTSFEHSVSSAIPEEASSEMGPGAHQFASSSARQNQFFSPREPPPRRR